MGAAVSIRVPCPASCGRLLGTAASLGRSCAPRPSTACQDGATAVLCRAGRRGRCVHGKLRLQSWTGPGGRGAGARGHGRPACHLGSTGTGNSWPHTTCHQHGRPHASPAGPKGPSPDLRAMSGAWCGVRRPWPGSLLLAPGARWAAFPRGHVSVEKESVASLTAVPPPRGAESSRWPCVACWSAPACEDGPTAGVPGALGAS